jgi:hypothetical protein
MLPNEMDLADMYHSTDDGSDRGTDIDYGPPIVDRQDPLP